MKTGECSDPRSIKVLKCVHFTQYVWMKTKSFESIHVYY